jgi:flagellin-like hook-associated protein FlgL
MSIGLSNFLPLSVDSVATRQNTTRLLNLRDEMGDLQRQLSTGKVSDTYAGLGRDAYKALDLSKTISRYDDYAAVNTDVSLRLKLMDTSLTNISKDANDVASALRNSTANTLPSNGQSLPQQTAVARMQTVIDALNMDAGGRYLFSGRATDTKPVLDFDTIMNGTPTQAGLKQLIGERRAADNPDTQGLVAIDKTTTAGTVSFTNASSPLGMTIGTAVSQSAAVTATPTAGPPPSADFVFTGVPADGETISISFTLPDGTSTTIALTARTGTADPAKSEFQVGADKDLTAVAFADAVTLKVKTAAATDLWAASAVAASTNFFSATPASPPTRMPGALPPAAAVQWYVGDTTSTNPRATATAQVGHGQSVEVGAQANEPALARLMAQLGVLSAETFTVGGVNEEARYEAMVERNTPGVTIGTGTSQKITDIQVALGIASSTAKTAGTRNTAMQATLKDALGEIQDADTTKVAVSLADLQTRLQASYQTTSMLSKMSLVNYLG